MKIFLRRILILLMVLAIPLTASQILFKKEVRVDNDFIHTYKDKLGRWLIPIENKNSMEKLYKEFGTSEEEVRIYNKLKPNESIPKYSPVFFPYSESALNNLISEGRDREAVLSDVREFIWPVGSAILRITSRLGKRWNSMHNGLDIACAKGSTVVAAADGIVIQSRQMGNYGNGVIIQHEFNNLQTMYAHNSILIAKEGDKVKKGQIIAFSGNTGHSTGPHLHFEVKYQNVVLNPEHYLPDLFKETADHKIAVIKQEKFVQ